MPKSKMSIPGAFKFLFPPEIGRFYYFCYFFYETFSCKYADIPGEIVLSQKTRLHIFAK